MPGNGLFQVKCEPTSEDENSNSQFTHIYFSNQVNYIYVIFKQCS